MDLTYLDDLWAFLGRHDALDRQPRGVEEIAQGYLYLAGIKIRYKRTPGNVMEAYRISSDKNALLENLKLAAERNAKEAEFCLHCIVANAYFSGGYEDIFGHKPTSVDGEIGRALARDIWQQTRGQQTRERTQ